MLPSCMQVVYPILWASQFAFLPSIPSVDTTKGVKDTSAALLYVRFFSSAEEMCSTVCMMVHQCLLLAHQARLLSEVAIDL